MPLTHILNNPQISLACLLHLHHVQLNTRSLAGQELPLGCCAVAGAEWEAEQPN